MVKYKEAKLEVTSFLFQSKDAFKKFEQTTHMSNA